jgi:hypothetical protein
LYINNICWRDNFISRELIFHCLALYFLGKLKPYRVKPSIDNVPQKSKYDEGNFIGELEKERKISIKLIINLKLWPYATISHQYTAIVEEFEKLFKYLDQILISIGIQRRNLLI